MSEGFVNLITKISTYADELMHTREDPQTRKMKQGVLGNSFPKLRRELAEAAIADARTEGWYTKYLQDPWRFCVYPFFEINIMVFCEQNFLKISAERCTQCKHLHCINCCNHLLLVLKFAT